MFLSYKKPTSRKKVNKVTLLSYLLTANVSLNVIPLFCALFWKLFAYAAVNRIEFLSGKQFATCNTASDLVTCFTFGYYDGPVKKHEKV